MKLGGPSSGADGGQVVCPLDDPRRLFPGFQGMNPEPKTIGHAHDVAAEGLASGLRTEDFDDLVRNSSLIELLPAQGSGGAGFSRALAASLEAAGRRLRFRTRFFPLRSQDSVLYGAGPDDALLGRIIRLVQGERLMAEDMASVAQLLEELEEKARQCTGGVPGLAIRRPDTRLKYYKKVWTDLVSLCNTLNDFSGQHTQVTNMVVGICQRVQQFIPAKETAAPPSPAQPGAVAARSTTGSRGGAGARGGRRTPSGPGQPQSVNKRKRTVDIRRGADGRPVMPIVLTPSQYVISLGRVVHDRAGFHSPNYIWPAGYRSVRMFFSAKNPSNRVSWTCEILDVGSDSPEFRLTPEDDRGNTLVGTTATAVWSEVLKLVKQKRVDSEKSMGNISGPEYFGFSHPTIARLLEELPGAQKCPHYKFQFVGKTPDKV